MFGGYGSLPGPSPHNHLLYFSLLSPLGKFEQDLGKILWNFVKIFSLGGTTIL